jgi:NAD(P)-dependent dehydrogenase (short-subunit alcohol dehydrogenase family)
MDVDRPFESLGGRTAVVTGAARGIGLEVARVLQSVGMTVVLADRDAQELERAHAELGASATSAAGAVVALVADLSSDECLPAVEAALAKAPPLAVWVNNAGRVSHQRAEGVDLAEFEQVLRDNTASALRGSQAAFRAMHDGGSIVNLSSLLAEKALPERLSYATSKAALENVTRYTAREWGPRGIRVNAISPGYIETRLTQWPEDDPRAVHKRATLAQLALPRAGTPEDIAHTVLYLSSPLASYVTGQILYLDGGWHLT